MHGNRATRSICYPSISADCFEMMRARKLCALSALTLILASCAQTGPPLPPSLELPKPPTDLRATRKGNKVTLTWSVPTLTTDHQSLRYLGPTLLCRTSGAEMTICVNQLAIVPPLTESQQAPKKSQPKNQQPTQFQTYIDTIPAEAQSDNASSEFTYAVEVLNRNARGAGLSNRVEVSAITTLAPPSDLAANLSEDGVTLTWTSVSAPPAQQGLVYRYRIYRRNEGALGGSVNAAESQVKGTNKKEKREAIVAELQVGPAGQAQFLDPIEWENTYQYWITAVTVITKGDTEVQVEGDDSNQVQVSAHDIFPPAVPGGLQAVYSGEGQRPFIDLIWAPVPSADLAGYIIYRREGDGPQVKLNSQPVKTPSHRDNAVTPGKTYTYSVSAVDVRGNESKQSEEASESIPQ
ncbi:MAG TPA: hypothetical protein VMI10_23760 [Terriglobales bacterium]|nr:hypothetical protein [Terriglobales bacterium]